MRGAAVAVVCILSGCSVLFDPSDLMGGAVGEDGGPRDDGGPADGGGPGDGGSCAPSVDYGAGAFAPIGAPSVSLGEVAGDVRAWVGVIGDATAGAAVLHYALTGGPELGLRETVPLDDIPAARRGGLRSIAVRRDGANVRYLVVGRPPDAGTTGSGVHVGSFGDEVSYTNLDDGGSGAEQHAAAITGTHYVWTESAPTPLVGSLPFTSTAASAFRKTVFGGSDRTDVLAASRGPVVGIAGGGTPIRMWNGTGPDMDSFAMAFEVEGVTHTLPPATAYLGRTHHVLGWVDGGALRLRLFDCGDALDTECIAATDPMDDPAAGATDMAMAGIPGAGVVVALRFADRIELRFFDDNLEDAGMDSIAIDDTTHGEIDLDALELDGVWHIGLTRFDITTSDLLLTHLALDC